MEVGVTVTAENPFTGERSLTTSALLTFVALNSDGSKAQVPKLTLRTVAEKQAFAEATARREARLTRRSTSPKWQKVLA
jgi:acyl-CoA hydrolase